MKYRFAGKEKKLSFGTYPDVSLANARARREEARKILAANNDPGEVKKAEQLAKKNSIENTFELSRLNGIPLKCLTGPKTIQVT